MRVRVVHRWRAMRGPAGVGDTGGGRDLFSPDIGFELGHARRAARAPELTQLMHRDAAGVVATVFQPLQAFEQDGNDIALADGADDATHGLSPLFDQVADARRGRVKVSAKMLTLVHEITNSMRLQNFHSMSRLQLV